MEEGIVMVFSSTFFLFAFLPLVLLAYYNPWHQKRSFRNRLLLGFSLFFYMWGEPLFVFIMVLSIIVAWFIGLKIDNSIERDVRKRFLSIGIIFHVGLFLVFKYLSFIAQQFGLIVNQDYSWLNIVLPIGISFFTFQLLSYLFDIYYGKADAQRSVVNVGLYVALFPQLIAGPIVRYGTIETQIINRRENMQDFCDGMIQFIYGLGKKVLIANYVAQISDNIFNTGEELSIAAAWLGAMSYTLQIYFDFSGYSDMAIGLGKMFGFKFNENFNYPYIAKSATEFWRRWHISLGTWFRDYVYIPLGGNRVSRIRWIFNLFIVWALTGIWHGANWTFLLWGLFYFVLLLIEKMTGFTEKMGVLSHVYALMVIIIGWVIFRSQDVISGITYIGAMFGIWGNEFIDNVYYYYWNNGFIVLLIAILLSMPILKFLKRWKIWSYIEPIAIVIIFILSLIKIVSNTYNPFIYFNF